MGIEQAVVSGLFVCFNAILFSLSLFTIVYVLEIKET